MSELISREALKNALQSKVDQDKDDLFVRGYNIGIEAAMELIDNAPTVTPDMTQMSIAYLKGRNQGQNDERPHGKWIKNKGRDLRDCFYTCSKCGRNINVICGETLVDYPFCHCGAKMDKEADNENRGRHQEPND